MKKILAVALLSILLAALTACSKPFTCDLCGEERTGKKHTSETYDIKMTVCDICYKEINALFSY